MRKIIYHAVDTLTNQKEGRFLSAVNQNQAEFQAERDSNEVELSEEPKWSDSETRPAQDCHQVLNFDGYNPAGLEDHFDKLEGSYYHNLIGRIEIKKATNRRSCSTGETYESLRVEIGRFGTGWIENWYFHQNSHRFGYPTSIKDDEDLSCCEGPRSLSTC